jgi:hypothetical protein
MLQFLRAKGIAQLALASRVATTTSPGGDQISFRGWVTAEADYGTRGQARYTEYLMPYIAQTKSPDLPALPGHADTLRAAQLSLARQLRTYRGEYRSLVEQARENLAARITQAGFTLTEPED